MLAGHERLILDHRFSLFVVNALCWPAADQNGKTGLNSEMHKLGPMLPKNNLQWTRTDLLVSDLKVFCCHSLTDVNVKKIVEFAVEGGGLPIGKQAWFSASRNPNFNSLCQFPENRFLKCSGLGILDKRCHKGLFPVPMPGVTNYHIHRALSQFESMLHNKGRNLETNWLEKLIEDSSYMCQVPQEGIPIDASVHKDILKMSKKRAYHL